MLAAASASLPWAWVLTTADTQKAQRRKEKKGWALESDLHEPEPMPGFEWPQVSELPCRKLSFRICRGETKTPAREGFCGNTRGNRCKSKRYLETEEARFPPLHSSLSTPLTLCPPGLSAAPLSRHLHQTMKVGKSDHQRRRGESPPGRSQHSVSVV